MDNNEIKPSAAVPLGKSAKSLPAQLADLLLAEVITGRLAPGDRLKEESLAQQHAVSRATVREALIALEKEGYVDRVPRFGARIAQYSQEDVRHIFEIRAALLALAAGRCARERDEEMAAELVDMVQNLEQLAAEESSDAQDFATQSLRAQTFVIRWSKNQRLLEFYDRLAGMGTWQLIRGRAISFLTPENRRQSASDWRHLANAIAKGDRVTAENGARQLLDHSAERVRENLFEIGRYSANASTESI